MARLIKAADARRFDAKYFGIYFGETSDGWDVTPDTFTKDTCPDGIEALAQYMVKSATKRIENSFGRKDIKVTIYGAVMQNGTWQKDEKLFTW